MSPGYLTAMHFLLQLCDPLLRNEMVAVARMHYGVLIAMKNDGRDSRPVSQNRRHVGGSGRSCQLALPHGGECRGDVVCGPASQTRMHADRRLHIRVGCPHDN